MKTNRERMADALASWVRTLDAEQYEFYRRLNITRLKDAVESAIDNAIVDAVSEAVAAERERIEKGCSAYSPSFQESKCLVCGYPTRNHFNACVFAQ